MSDTALQTAGRYFDSELIGPLRESIVGRKLIAENPTCKGDGIYNVDINKVSEMGGGMISYQLPGSDVARDAIKVDRRNVNIPVLFKPFLVPRQDFEAWRNKGVALDSGAAISAAQMVGVQEDQLIIKGWNPNGDGITYEVPGMYTVTGTNGVTSSLPFSTPGNATKAIASAYAMIEEDFALGQAYNLILNATQWGELLMSRHSASSQRELPEVIEMINMGNPNGPGRIVVTSALSDTQGILAPVDPARQFMEIYVPKDVSTDVGMDSKAPATSPIYGTVWGLTFPHFKHPEAIATFSAI